MPLVTLAETEFRGTMVELLARLKELGGGDAGRTPIWPRTANSLGNMLRRMTGHLRSAGIEIQFNRQHGGRRTVFIRSRRAS
jgi:hypothetical protein